MLIKVLQCLPAILSLMVTILQAQTPTVRKPGLVKQVIAFRPPVVKTFLGRNTQTAEVTLDEATQLINLPLRVSDDKGNIYIISSYQFLYKKKSSIENEETGKREIVFGNVADIFKASPLPVIWRKNIGESIQKGEELYFFDIIAGDKSGRKFFAPEIKILVR